MCKKVQVERPSASTSGGQSGGGSWVEAEDVEVVEWVVDGVAEALSFLVMAAQEEKEVQERQL